MPIDITKFSEAQLSQLNQKIVARLKFLQETRMRQQMQNFEVGDQVSFHAPGHDPKVGIVAKCNRKTITVITDDRHQWNVAPVFLSRVIASETQSQAAPSQVIHLPSKR